MSCTEFRNSWFSTDAEACYVAPGAVGTMLRCVCPFSTCVTNGNSHTCELTAFSWSILVVVMGIWWVGLIVYLRLSWSYREAADSRVAPTPYRDVLFGVYNVSDETKGLAENAKGPQTSGNTFDK